MQHSVAGFLGARFRLQDGAFGDGMGFAQGGGFLPCCIHLGLLLLETANLQCGLPQLPLGFVQCLGCRVSLLRCREGGCGPFRFGVRFEQLLAQFQNYCLPLRTHIWRC